MYSGTKRVPIRTKRVSIKKRGRKCWGGLAEKWLTEKWGSDFRQKHGGKKITADLSVLPLIGAD
jgi:hypothetical protein